MLTQDDSKVAAIYSWQNAGYLHPLTCGTNSEHALLVPHKIVEGVIVLRCRDCDYVQTSVPGVVYSRWERISSGAEEEYPLDSWVVGYKNWENGIRT